MTKTEVMLEREKLLRVKWRDEGDGYFSLTGYGRFSAVAYVALPKGHIDIGKKYDDLEPDVNGGLTFGEDNVFGWDYSHFQNFGTPNEHIKNAIEYFKRRTT